MGMNIWIGFGSRNRFCIESVQSWKTFCYPMATWTSPMRATGWPHPDLRALICTGKGFKRHRGAFSTLKASFLLPHRIPTFPCPFHPAHGNQNPPPRSPLRELPGRLRLSDELEGSVLRAAGAAHAHHGGDRAFLEG